MHWGVVMLVLWLGNPATLVAGTPTVAEFQVVDLTHTLAPGIPAWPGSSPMVLTPRALPERDGYFANDLCLPEHFGTHLDAPVHFSPQGWHPDALPLDHLVAPVVVVDVRDKVKTKPDYAVALEDIRAWERKYGPIPPRSVVLAWTGWSQRWSDPAAYRNMDPQKVMHFPGYAAETVRFLVEQRQVVGLGIDTLSLDPGPSPDFAAHRIGARANVYNLENLAHLDRLPPRGAYLVVAPLPIREGSGSPARVYALVPRVSSRTVQRQP